MRGSSFIFVPRLHASERGGLTWICGHFTNVCSARQSSLVLRFVNNDFQENKEPTIGGTIPSHRAVLC
jgi:hypothetical protein